MVCTATKELETSRDRCMLPEKRRAILLYLEVYKMTVISVFKKVKVKEMLLVLIQLPSNIGKMPLRPLNAFSCNSEYAVYQTNFINCSSLYPEYKCDIHVVVVTSGKAFFCHSMHEAKVFSHVNVTMVTVVACSVNLLPGVVTDNC